MYSKNTIQSIDWRKTVNNFLPNSFLSILELAGIAIFFVTALAALISVFITRRNGLIYLGTQSALLFLFLFIARSWVQPLFFSNAFDEPTEFGRIVITASILSLAFATTMSMRIFVWEGSVFKRDNSPVPGLLIGLADFFIYLFAILIILQFVFGQSITAIATLSGAAAVVLGFSAQSTLGEMFAGVALSISRPFKVGDWIYVDGLDEGKVIDQTWRHVQIRTRDHSILNVANSLISEKSIKNYSSSHSKIRICELIHFNQSVNPAKIQDLLQDEIIKSNIVLSHPAPTVFFKGVVGDKFEFEISYFIDNYEHRPIKSDALWKLIVDTVQKSGYGLAVLSK